jgi:hypothetical protein
MDQVFFGTPAGVIAGAGAGQTIVIIVAYDVPTLQADLHAFDLQFGLPDPTLVVINQRGGTSLPSPDPWGAWGLEASMDVQWSHAMAPAAKIVLVEADSASVSDMMQAVDTARKYPGASVVSMSWGSDEATSDVLRNETFKTPAGHSGVTFLAASGDFGAYLSTAERAVGYPASSPNVVSVGGTRLTLGPTGGYLSETGWGHGVTSLYDGGSGGGISRVQTLPTYQKGVVTQTNGFRGAPDVALLADPDTGAAVYDSWDSPGSPWAVVGGTSLATPMWAGIIAVANQGRAIAKLPALDGLTQTLPTLYKMPAADFHDVAAGNNGYAAKAGYDLVTGRGSPVVNKLVADLIGVPLYGPPAIGAVGTFTAAASIAAVPVGTSVNLLATDVAQVNGAIAGVTVYRETNGVPGLQPGADLLVGKAAKSGAAWKLALSTKGMAAGAYTYYAVAAGAGNLSSPPAATVLTVTPLPPANDAFAKPAPLTGLAPSAAGTTVAATAEAGEPAHAGAAPGPSAWWSWKAPASGVVTLDTAGSAVDTVLAVYTGTKLAALTPVAANDDDTANGLTTSRVTFRAVAGVTYRIAVAGKAADGGSPQGAVLLHLVETPAPANDAFAKALALPAAAQWTGSTAAASAEAGEPNVAAAAGGASVWFKWKAPVTGDVAFSTAGSGFDTLLAVFTGTSLPGLTLVADNNDAGANDTTSRVTFHAVAGVTYRILVDGLDGVTGSVALAGTSA